MISSICGGICGHQDPTERRSIFEEEYTQGDEEDYVLAELRLDDLTKLLEKV